MHLFTFSVFPGVLELKSVTSGHVVIKGQSTSLFLCVDSGGHLSGQVSKKSLNILKLWSFLSIRSPPQTVYMCCVVTCRGTMQRLTAPSENCCWQMDTPVSFPHTMDFQCLWHQNIPQINTQSLSHDSYQLGIL